MAVDGRVTSGKAVSMRFALASEMRVGIAERPDGESSILSPAGSVLSSNPAPARQITSIAMAGTVLKRGSM